MAYGLSPHLFVEDGPSAQVAREDRLRSTARTWHGLGPAGRWAMVESAMRPANDRIDEYPLAL